MPHGLGNVTVYVQSESGGSMAQVALYGFDIVAAPDCGNGIRMPLWHNKYVQYWGAFACRTVAANR